jgi:hypothetical protein
MTTAKMNDFISKCLKHEQSCYSTPPHFIQIFVTDKMRQADGQKDANWHA